MISISLQSQKIKETEDTGYPFLSYNEKISDTTIVKRGITPPEYYRDNMVLTKGIMAQHHVGNC